METDLAGVRARLAAANGGPWVWVGGAVYGAVDLKPDEPYLIAHVTDRGDEEFIAHARDDVPMLLALVDAQAARLAAVERVIADNQWIRASHGVTRANDLRPRGYCTSCGDKHPCDSLGLLEDIEAAAGAAGEERDASR